MSNDVTQWLAEIKRLQQQLAQTQQERDGAYESATNWRKLYETEAQQRRSETGLYQQKIEALMVQIQQLRGLPAVGGELANAEMLREVDQLTNDADLKQRLREALQQRDQLAQALKEEQANHAQTRKSLTTALGDTVDLLAKERAERQQEQEESTTFAQNHLPEEESDQQEQTD